MKFFTSWEIFHKAFVLPLVVNRRIFLAIILLMMTNIFQSITIWKLVTLRHEGRFVLVEGTDGSLKVLHARPFRPEDSNVSYFIRLWVDRLLSADIRSVRQNLSLASAWVRGEAVTDLYRFVRSDMIGKNFSNDKGYVRSVSFRSLVFGGKGTLRHADLTLTLTVTSDGKIISRKDKMMHVEFFLVPPVSELDSQTNPLGLFITHFRIVPMNASGLF
ncbi:MULTISPECIES: type IV secretion system protein [Candidatus Ichthyocystis]|uniref:Putative pilus protein, VirB8 n=1 Tax=Candidatus Ichthyocystis hellenicum TaxID=1561003 RepID=A0A0S4M1B5_9BURK|nr:MULTISPECIES: type IV secretion system protein [Ichthyocystis]CUT17575.1 putative pilus protein, VirB8 [Candidatus Ichthyocystis hellenicum]